MILAVAGIGAAFSGISTIIAGVTAVFGLFSAPVLVVIAAIGALIAAGYALYTNWETITQGITDYWTLFKEGALMVWDAIKVGLNAAWDAITAPYRLMWDTAKTIGLGLIEAFNAVWEGIQTFWQGVKDAFNSAISWVSEKWQGFLGLISGGLGVIQDAISWLGTLLSYFGGTLNITQPDIPGNAEGTDNWRGGLTWVGEKGPELLNLPRGSQILSNRDSVALANQKTNNINAPITINAAPGMSANQIADAVYQRLDRGMRLAGSY
jgi:phage-related protein